MSRTSASGDDAVVGQTIPCTTVDPSKGTGTTLLASSSNVNNTDDAGKQAVIVRPSQNWASRRLPLRGLLRKFSKKNVIVGFCLCIE